MFRNAFEVKSKSILFAMDNNNQKQELLDFLDEVDEFTERLENHPTLMVYFIGTTDQLRNSTTAARTSLESSK